MSFAGIQGIHGLWGGIYFIILNAIKETKRKFIQKKWLFLLHAVSIKNHHVFHKTNPSTLQDGNLKIRSKISAACRYDFQQVKYLTSNGRRRQLSEKPKFAPQRRRAQNINRHWSAAPRQTQLGSWLVCPNTIFRRRARSPFLFYDLPIFLDRRPTMMLAIPLNGVLSVLAAILRTTHFKKGPRRHRRRRALIYGGEPSAQNSRKSWPKTDGTVLRNHLPGKALPQSDITKVKFPPIYVGYVSRHLELGLFDVPIRGVPLNRRELWSTSIGLYR